MPRPDQDTTAGSPDAAPLKIAAPITEPQPTTAGTTSWQEVVELFDELEQAWLAYELDPQNYFLARPILRDNTVPATAAYLEARFAAKEAIDDAPPTPDTPYITKVDKLVETAWEAWRLAYDHALSIGLDDRPPAEKKALRWAAGALKHLQRPDITADERSHYLQVLQDNINVLKTVPVPAKAMSRIRAQIAAANHPQITAAPATETG
jgi:hypothetical protein